MLVRLSRDLVMTPGLVARAEALIRGSGKDGITVSAFREAMGTSRKYALLLLEHLDQAKVTVRRGDLRFPREPAPSAESTFASTATSTGAPSGSSATPTA